MKIRKTFREIQLIGIKDWWWFVITLKRSEFSNKLRMFLYKDMNKLIKDRERAHNIDCTLRHLQ